MISKTQASDPSTSLKNSIFNFIFVKKGGEGFRTFHGVFLPSILSILGVILYLRLGWIVGEMGFALTTSIICIASTITLITAFSISATSTNMRVGNGGAYFIISRSFGTAIGSAIGLPLYCAQAIGIAFYIMGFAESVHFIFPVFDIHLIEFSTLAVLGILSIISTNLVMRAQFFIFLFIVLSIISFVLGIDVKTTADITNAPITHSLGYWAAFAIFFPAVTGLEAGVSMSGELKNPQRSLPLGTISAVLMGLIIYLSITYLLWARVPQDLLIKDTMIMEKIAWSGPLIILGIFGATLSSALGSIMAAPRTLQAISEDGILPKFISKKFGKNAEPRIASFITLIVVALCLYLGELNYIAPILTMFFLMSYGMLNLAAGFEGLISNPSWRPTIYIPSSISLFGACLCLITMLLIDASYTMIAALFTIPIYVIMKRRSTSKFDDIRQGILLFYLRKFLYLLADTTFSPRSWRPNVLAFPRNLTPSASLLNFTSNITGGKGFLTIAHCYQDDKETHTLEKMKSMLKQTLFLKKIPSLVEIFTDSNIVNGVKNMIKAYGIGPLRPNTVVIKIDETAINTLMIDQLSSTTYESHKNLILLAENHFPDELEPIEQLDIWWDEQSHENNDLMVVLGHMYSNASLNKNFKINLKSIVKDEIAKEKRIHYFEELFSKNRLNIQSSVYVGNRSENEKMLSHFYNEDAMAFIGIRPMQDHESPEEYHAYLHKILHHTKKYKEVGLFLATEKIELDQIIGSMK
jgi:solute carrier family 12 (potassium/chloride transporter), member 4/6